MIRALRMWLLRMKLDRKQQELEFMMSAAPEIERRVVELTRECAVLQRRCLVLDVPALDRRTAIHLAYSAPAPRHPQQKRKAS
jgi:hypothetical protein